MLNRASRAMSVVGLTGSLAGGMILRPRYFPLMILTVKNSLMDNTGEWEVPKAQG